MSMRKLAMTVTFRAFWHSARRVHVRAGNRIVRTYGLGRPRKAALLAARTNFCLTYDSLCFLLLCKKKNQFFFFLLYI